MFSPTRTIDAVAIATPVVTHYALATPALEAGKHVFVEKPLAASLERGGRARSSSPRERGLVLMPGHTFLYSPPVQRDRELITAGELGEIYFISTSRVNLGLHQPDVSVVWDLGPHDFSILRYWLGETPTHVTALSRGCVIPGTPDVAFINLEFPSGTIAHVELVLARAEQAAPDDDRRLPEDGRLRRHERRAGAGVRLRRQIRDPDSFGEYQLSYRTGDIVSPRVDAVGAALDRARGLLRRDPHRHGAAVERRDRPRRRSRRRGGGALAAWWGHTYAGRSERRLGQRDLTGSETAVPARSNSAIWIAFSAAPLRRLSLER